MREGEPFEYLEEDQSQQMKVLAAHENNKESNEVGVGQGEEWPGVRSNGPRGPW